MKSSRKIIWAKTGGRCFYCGLPFVVEHPKPEERDWLLTQIRSTMGVDHAYPTRRGGTDDLSNLLPCCSACNSEKNQSTIEEYRLRLGLANSALPHRFAGDRQTRADRDYIVVASVAFHRCLIAHNFPNAYKQQKYSGWRTP